MTGVKNVYKKIVKDKKILFSLTFIGILLLILGIKSTYAYYHNSDSFGVLSALVGDFDTGTGDINIMVYKINDNGTKTKIYNIPELGYIFDDELTSCSIECKNTTEDPNASCHYTFNSSETTQDKAFSLTSNEKVTCKFYFRKQLDADIKVLIMKESDNGTEKYSGSDGVERTYQMVEEVPAYGYVYSNNYKCDSNVESFEYDATTRKFKVGTKTKNVCYAYFNSAGDADAIVNVFVQATKGGKVYNEVNSIPVNKKYQISTNPLHKTACYLDSGVESGIVPTYVDGYINVLNLKEKQTCDVYLDLVE